MGLKIVPSMFNKVLMEDMENLGGKVTSTVIKYLDDIILCALNMETCHKDSMILLTVLTEHG